MVSIVSNMAGLCVDIDFRLSQWLAVDVNSVPGLLLCVDMGYV